MKLGFLIKRKEVDNKCYMLNTKILILTWIYSGECFVGYNTLQPGHIDIIRNDKLFWDDRQGYTLLNGNIEYNYFSTEYYNDFGYNKVILYGSKDK